MSLFAWVLSIDFVILDQISKYLVLRFWPDLASINPNIAFGIPIPNAVMLALSPLLLLGFAYVFQKYAASRRKLSIFAFACVIGGGASNFLDRLFRGGVIDFIDLGFWPSFNLADSFISIGVFTLLLFHAKIFVTHGRS